MSALPKTVVIGARGFVGGAFFQTYQRVYPDLIGTHHTPHEGLHLLNLATPSLEGLALEGYTYALIGAGVGNPRRCESNPAQSYACNVTGTLALAAQCISRGITPVLFSTDYVFDGVAGNYEESSALQPLNTYGMQKAELEKDALTRFPQECLLIRLSKVYGTQRGDGTLLDEMIAHLLHKRKIRVAADQLFAPIHVRDVVSGITTLMQQDKRGVFQLAGDETQSRLSVALAVLARFGLSRELIEVISLDDLDEPFVRPKNTTLKITKICSETGLKPLRIREALEELVGQYA